MNTHQGASLGFFWVVTDESPHGEEEIDSGVGFSLVGCFSTAEEAFGYLKYAVIGPERYDRLAWSRSPHNENHYSGSAWRDESYDAYIITRHQIDTSPYTEALPTIETEKE